MHEHELHHAFLEMSNTLSNWTLHRQNLGSMLSNYHSQGRNLKISQRHKLAHFFNMTSNILDTFGSMTENTILKSVEFIKGGGGDVELKGGGVFGNDKKGLKTNDLLHYFQMQKIYHTVWPYFWGIHWTTGMCQPLNQMWVKSYSLQNIQITQNQLS